MTLDVLLDSKPNILDAAAANLNPNMRKQLKQHIAKVCAEKIASKGEDVGISFYAFFKNRNDEPELLMEVATWWIQIHRLDHFEKAVKIKAMVENQSPEL